MKRFPNKKVFISFVAISILTGVFVFMLARKKEPKSLSDVKNPQLVVKKKERLLQVYDEGELVKTYKVALGRAPQGDKQIEGDGKTPEGEFYVFTKNDKSKFYLSLGLSYPNAEAAQRGLKENLITREEYDEILKAIAEKRMPPQKTALGGEIYIHGGGISNDWTEGCMALPNEEIKELFAAIPVGTNVSIQP
ncbi:MAG TPA: L,D-transpeptidase [Pyrinomonadaceae bacterium]|jgi:murein L,D-transpeptidase YafK